MRRWWCVVIAAFAAAAATASSPEPSRETFAALVRTCTADGAFGHRFGEKNLKPGKEDGIAPFFIETLSADTGNAVFEIAAVASFAKAPMSQEDRVALANWVFRKIDADVTATRRFTQRQPRADDVRFSTAAFALDLSHDGTTVRMACSDLARKNAAQLQKRER